MKYAFIDIPVYGSGQTLTCVVLRLATFQYVPFASPLGQHP